MVSDIDAPVPELPGSPAVDEILQPVSIRNSTIIGVDGQPLHICGINWSALAWPAARAYMLQYISATHLDLA